MSIDDLFREAERFRLRTAIRRHTDETYAVRPVPPVPEISEEEEEALLRRIFADDG